MKTLIIPLYLWNCVYALVAQLLSIRGFEFGIGVSVQQLLFLPLYNGHQYMYNLPTWFIAPLFMVEVFNVFYRKVLFLFKGYIKEIIYFSFAFVLGMLGIYLSVHGHNVGWGLAVTRWLYFVPFYCGGFFYKKVLEKKFNSIPSVIYLLGILFLELVIIYKRNGAIEWIQSWSEFWEFNAWPFVVGFLGIAFWLRIAYILEPAIGRSKVVNLIADNTFSIMTNHLIGFIIIKSVFAFFNSNVYGKFTDFDWVAYHTDIEYCYYPKGIEAIGLVYIVTGIALSILIQKMIDKIKHLLEERFELVNTNLGKALIYVMVIIMTVAPAKWIANNVENLSKIEANAGIYIVDDGEDMTGLPFTMRQDKVV